MIRIEKNVYNKIYKLYQSSEAFFPLIAAVLQDRQDGVVYADDPTSPSQAYVEHAFGFAQIFGKTIDAFEQELEHYLLVGKHFNPGKIRLYTPCLPRFLSLPKYESLRSYRQRFFINWIHFKNDIINDDVTLCKVTEFNIDSIENNFGIIGRFWRTPDDFIRESNAVVVFYDGKPASICYSAAEVDHQVEIDVFTLPEYRNMGLAKIAVTNFIRKCLILSLCPLWDCFTNNSGSMTLCKSIGFVAPNAPYSFFTIDK